MQQINTLSKLGNRHFIHLKKQRLFVNLKFLRNSSFSLRFYQLKVRKFIQRFFIDENLIEPEYLSLEIPKDLDAYIKKVAS